VDLSRLRNIIIRHSTNITLRSTALMARGDSGDAVASRVMTSFARLVSVARGIRPSTDTSELAEQWQRGFAAKKQVPITKLEGNTAYAEIHTPCPLAGTGDLAACHRMMAYDREIVRRAGGKFEVLESQATPGVTFCRVAVHLFDVAPPRS
jgi:hypothetical protein